jgi:hypothetical protein
LRALYGESALVAVAHVGDSVAVERGEGAPLKRTALRISSLLKGESKERDVHLYHYAGAEMDEDFPYAFVKNDVLLVFLNPNEDGEGYVPADYERGIKKLPPDDLKVYVARIEELASIMRSKKPDAAALTEWIVRCAEEPATRWEGAYELASDAFLFPDQKESAADSDARAANTASVVVVVKTDEGQVKGEGDSAGREVTTTEAVRPNDGDESGQRAKLYEILRRLNQEKEEERIDFVARLTPAQKERLTTALLAAEKLDQGEQMLLRLVGNWKDARLVPFSLNYLARVADQPPYHTQDLMQIVAHTLGDRTLIKFVADYNEVVSYEDLYDADEDDEDEDEDFEATDEERAARKKEIAETKAAAAEARLVRSGKLRHFLALAEQPQKP